MADRLETSRLTVAEIGDFQGINMAFNQTNYLTS